MKKRTIQSEVAGRVRLKIEILALILKPQSAVFWGYCECRIRVRVSGPNNTLFMVRVRFRVISGCGHMLKMSTAVPIKLQSVLSFF